MRHLARTTCLGTATAALLITAAGARAETFRWAGTTDPQTMDPHAANLAPVTSFLNNVYEGPRSPRQGHVDRAVARHLVGAARGRTRLALRPAGGRHLPRRFGLHGGRRAVLVRAGHLRAVGREIVVRPGRRGACRRRLHGGLRHHQPQPALSRQHRQLDDHGPRLGRGERHRGACARRGDLRHAQHERHGTLRPDVARSGRGDAARPQPRLVGHARAQHHRGDLQPDRDRRDRPRRARFGRGRHARAGPDPAMSSVCARSTASGPSRGSRRG
jgi:hypothetical protein